MTKGIGALPVYNDKFYAEIFMKPWYHFNSYLLGIVMCIIFKTFLKENVSDASSLEIRNSNSSRMLVAIKSNICIRYPLYILGLGLIIATFIGCRPYYLNMSNWSSVV